MAIRVKMKFSIRELQYKRHKFRENRKNVFNIERAVRKGKNEALNDCN